MVQYECVRKRITKRYLLQQYQKPLSYAIPYRSTLYQRLSPDTMLSDKEA